MKFRYVLIKIDAKNVGFGQFGQTLRKNQQNITITSKIRFCSFLVNYAEFGTVQKCERLVDLEKINAEKCVF